MSAPVHVERAALNRDTNGIDVWTMWCGDQCLAFPDATLAPDGFDFYTEEHAHKATCEPCMAAFAVAHAKALAEAV